MKKINRRTFLQQAGLVTAALAAGMYDQVAARPSSGTAAGSLPSAATDDITSENGRFTAALRDHGRALTNPGMGIFTRTSSPTTDRSSNRPIRWTIFRG